MARPLKIILSVAQLGKILTIQDLKDLDDAELKAVIEAQTPVKLDNEAA